MPSSKNKRPGGLQRPEVHITADWCRARKLSKSGDTYMLPSTAPPSGVPPLWVFGDAHVFVHVPLQSRRLLCEGTLHVFSSLRVDGAMHCGMLRMHSGSLLDAEMLVTELVTAYDSRLHVDSLVVNGDAVFDGDLHVRRVVVKGLLALTGTHNVEKTGELVVERLMCDPRSTDRRIHVIGSALPLPDLWPEWTLRFGAPGFSGIDSVATFAAWLTGAASRLLVDRDDLREDERWLLSLTSEDGMRATAVRTMHRLFGEMIEESRRNAGG